MSFLVLDNVSKSYGTTRVLHEITLSIPRGDFICLLGPSGSGKSTLLNCIMGLTHPTSGTCLLSGTDITTAPPEKRNFGVVFQEYALFPNLTVAQNIQYGLHKKTWSPEQRTLRTQELLALVGLTGFDHIYPDDLSGGQQQRVALARAIAPNPSLLLLDEPLSALDAQVRGQLRNELKKIQKETGITTVMVTHDQEEAFELADTIYLIHEGRIEQQGTPLALHTAPESEFVANFIGTMNILSVDWLRGGKHTGIRFEDVLVQEATEQTLAVPHSCTGRVETISFRGAFSRVELLLSDYKTHVCADVPTRDIFFSVKDTIAVTFPEKQWCIWDQPA